MEIHNPKNTTKLAKLFVFISRDAQGKEGIMGSEVGQWITGSEKIRDEFQRIARSVKRYAPDKKIFMLEYVPNGSETEL